MKPIKTIKRYSYKTYSPSGSSANSSMNSTPCSSMDSSPSAESLADLRAKSVMIGKDSPSPAVGVVGRSRSSARRYGVPSSRASSVLSRSSLHSSHKVLDTEGQESDSEMSDESDFEAVSRSKVCDWAKVGSASSKKIISEDAEEKVAAIFQKHLGSSYKKFSVKDLDHCKTPTSSNKRAMLSEGDTLSDDDVLSSDEEDGAMKSDSDKAHDGDVTQMKANPQKSANSDDESEDEDLLFDTTPVSRSPVLSPAATAVGKPSPCLSQATTPRRVHVRWPLEVTGTALLVNDAHSPEAATRSEAAVAVAFPSTPNCSVCEIFRLYNMHCFNILISF